MEREGGVEMRKLCGLFIGLFCLLFPINAQAYFGKNEDYILADQKPAEKVIGH